MKGEGNWSVDVHEKELIKKLTVISMEGHQVTIHSVPMVFRYQYGHWYIPDKIIRMYHLFSTISPDAPADLRWACGLSVTLPGFFPPFMDERVQRKYAISAYVDLLLKRVKQVGTGLL
jgi:hypothetical protein